MCQYDVLQWWGQNLTFVICPCKNIAKFSEERFILCDLFNWAWGSKRNVFNVTWNNINVHFNGGGNISHVSLLKGIRSWNQILEPIDSVGRNEILCFDDVGLGRTYGRKEEQWCMSSQGCSDVESASMMCSYDVKIRGVEVLCRVKPYLGVILWRGTLTLVECILLMMGPIDDEML